MHTARQVTLLLTALFWGILVGGIAYSHIVYFPPYLSHLPESNQLITGEYGLHDENFWPVVHSLNILFLITTLILNWKLQPRRKLILIALGIYVLAIIATATYYVPELMAFAKTDASVTKAEWLERGQTWFYLSLIRACFMCLGFILLLIALTKNNNDRRLNGAS